MCKFIDLSVCCVQCVPTRPLALLNHGSRVIIDGPHFLEAEAAGPAYYSTHSNDSILGPIEAVLALASACRLQHDLIRPNFIFPSTYRQLTSHVLPVSMIIDRTDGGTGLSCRIATGNRNLLYRPRLITYIHLKDTDLSL